MFEINLTRVEPPGDSLNVEQERMRSNGLRLLARIIARHALTRHEHLAVDASDGNLPRKDHAA